MAFFEQRLDPRITVGAKGGPQWSTHVVRSASGRRFTNRQWAYPLHKYDVSHGLHSAADFEALRSFFMVVYGMADSFRFKDWADYRCTQGNSNLTFIAGSTWQLNRVYAVGARSFVRPIQKPVAGVVVYRTRATVVTVASTTVDTTTGIATVTGHVAGDTYTWEGEFDVPVAFVSDFADIEMIGGGGAMLQDWSGIQIEEVRL